MLCSLWDTNPARCHAVLSGVSPCCAMCCALLRFAMLCHVLCAVLCVKQRVGVGPTGDILDIIKSWPAEEQQRAHAAIEEIEDQALKDMQVCRYVLQESVFGGGEALHWWCWGQGDCWEQRSSSGHMQGLRRLKTKRSKTCRCVVVGIRTWHSGESSRHMQQWQVDVFLVDGGALQNCVLESVEAQD